MLKIGDFSKLAQVSVKTLRYYADLELLKPNSVDRYTGYRYYTPQQLPRLNRILALKDLGFSLVQIEHLLREDLPAQELQRLMQLRVAELQEQVQAEQARLARVQLRLQEIAQEGRLPSYEVLVKRIEPRLVAGIRDNVSDFRDVGGLLGELNNYLSSQGCEPDRHDPALAVYYDAEYRDQGADVEVAVPLDWRLRGNARVAVHELPGAETMASLVHQGSYETLTGAYRAVMTWTQAHGYRMAGPNREIYLQGPAPGLEARGYVTELQVPLSSVSACTTTGPGKEGHTMEPRIVTKPAFTVVGLPFAGPISNPPFEAGQNNNEIGLLWGRLNPRCAEIKHVCGPAYGLCFGMPNDTEPWYIAGLEVSKVEDLTAGMVSMTVPEQKYAVFDCTLGKLGATYRYIMEEWQPATGVEHAQVPDFEYYDEEINAADPQNTPMHVYWPIKG